METVEIVHSMGVIGVAAAIEVHVRKMCMPTVFCFARRLYTVQPILHAMGLYSYFNQHFSIEKYVSLNIIFGFFVIC